MRRRFSHAVVLVALAVLTMVLGAATAPAASRDRGDRVSKEERKLVQDARDQGKSTVIVLIAAKEGQAPAAKAGVAALGGKVGYQDDALGYIRAAVPLANVEAVFALDSVEAADVDRTIPYEDPKPENISGVLPQPAPGAATPRVNAYMPTRDTGAAQWVNANPRWDGRGTTIGIVDTGVSFDHPSLTQTSTGDRKIVDWVTGTDPLTDGDPTWVNMSTQVTGASFVWNGVTYTAPRAGSWRIGSFSETAPGFGGEYATVAGPGGDVNRDGDHADRFPILWDSARDVWVDTDQDNSFADQATMRDYNVRYDIGWFGTDNPATPVAERVPFVVQTDRTNNYVNIGIVSGAHGSHVAGIAAGNRLFGGQMSGAAPGAKIVSSRACLFTAGCTNHALFEGMIYVAKRRKVDVINLSIGGLPALNDGNNARCELYDRLIEEERIQMFFSAGNSGPGLNTTGDPGLCNKVLGIGASITSETYERNYGTPMPFADNLHYFSSRGPREDGGISPELVAPGAAISTTPMWQPPGTGPVGGTFVLPPGYSMFNGTSMAAPQATGVGALLVSAAKREDVRHRPAQLRQALVSSARYLDPSRFQVVDQGFGLMNIQGAWNILRKKVETTEITGTVPVNTLLSDFLATPDVGTGIYDREGVTAGTAYTRTFTFTRLSHGQRGNDHDEGDDDDDGDGDDNQNRRGGGHSYDVRWIGNDGTFSSPSRIRLRNNNPTTMDVRVKPTIGSHSAILVLDDPSTRGWDYWTTNTVIAPMVFSAPSFTHTISSDIHRGQTKHYFFRVPAGTPAFKVDMTGGGDAVGSGAIRFIRWHPWGLGQDSNAASNCYNPNFGGCTTGSPTSRTLTNPQAGVWEVTIDAHRRSDSYPSAAPFTLTAGILGATVSPNPDVIDTLAIGPPGIDRTYTLTNLFGAFTGRAVGTALGSARRGVFTIADLAVQEYPVTIPAGTTSFRATIGSPSDPAADLDLFVYRCPTPTTCVLVGLSADGDSEESVTLNNPSANQYKVVVDGFDVPAGTTTYRYIDVFFTTPSFGAITIADANALRPAGSSWTVIGNVTANAAPAAGRVLYGNVEVRTDTNVLVGSGEVIVTNVTP